MPARARQRATYEDLLRVPDHMVAEIIEGELYASPRPRSRHADVAAALLTLVRSQFGRGGSGPGGWHVLMEPELHLSENVLVPDLAGWRVENMETMPDVAAFDLAPDWVCEVLSTSTARVDRVKKMPIYALHGVKHAWIVDPEQQTLEVYRLENGLWVRPSAFSGAEIARAEPFDAIEIDLARIWGDAPAPPAS